MMNETMRFDDHMNAGRVGFRLNYSSLWHLWQGGERLRVSDRIVIERTVLIVDVSKWQGEIDFHKMKLSGVHGVIIKCGQGTAQDPRFRENMIKAKEAGLARGTYWYFDSRVSPVTQAKLWAEWIADDAGELMHFADYEENYNGPYPGWNNLYNLIATFQSYSHLPDDRIGIYTGYYYWIAHSPTVPESLAWFGKFDLWLAWYTDNPAVVIIPKPWTSDNTSFVFWQYGTPANGVLRGCQSLDIDENNFNGDMETYTQRFNLSEIPPGNGGPVTKYTVIFPDNSGVALRPDHNTGNKAYGYIPAGTTIGTDDEPFIATTPLVDSLGKTYQMVGDKWAKVQYIFNGVLRIGWVAIIHMGGAVCTLRNNQTPPPTTTPPMPYTITLGDDITYTKVTYSGVLQPK